MTAMQSASAKKLVYAALLAVAGSASWATAQGPTDFLRRIDENGNGMIDPQELEGRMGGFIRRMAENNPRLDLSRPIPLDRLTEEFARMREERSRSSGGGPPGGGPPGGMSPWGGGPPGGMSPWGGGDRSSGDRGGGDRGSTPAQQGSSYGPRTTTVKPLVPAFGVETVSTPPPGFGAEGELFTIVITEDDRREAERAFRYYDRNHDGKVDADEMRNNRYGADLPMYDRNRDGVITMSEMEYRYARLRMENTQDSRNRGGDRRESDRRRGGGSNERDGDDRSGAGEDTEVRSYRRSSPLERLPAGLPDWFARDDADSDGQIAMHEFSTAWTDAVLAEFLQFDLNGDGLITPTECLAAQDNGAVRGGSIGISSGATPATTVAVASPASADSRADHSAAATESSATPAVSDVKIDARYMEYFRKVLAKYDSNTDGELTANEWASMSKDPTPADTDGNGRITLEEFARWQIQR
jgi:Ca2+-binding EF-hand superfamily protein